MNLSTDELTQLRAEAESYQPDTCTIQEVGATADTVGGWSETVTTRASGVACRLAPVATGSGGETMKGAQVESYNVFVLTIPHDQAIEATDRVVHDDITYEVEHIDGSHSNRTAKRVIVRIVE